MLNKSDQKTIRDYGEAQKHMIDEIRLIEQIERFFADRPEIDSLEKLDGYAAEAKRAGLELDRIHRYLKARIESYSKKGRNPFPVTVLAEGLNTAWEGLNVILE